MRRVLGLMLVVLMLAAVFAPAMSAREITITWWTNPWRIAPPDLPEGEAPTAEDFPRWVSEEFMRLHPNVRVEYEVVPNAGYDQKISAAILAGNPPDVLKDYQFRLDWARRGLLEPIDPWVSEEDWNDWYDYTLEKGRVGENHYIFPWNNSNNGMGSAMLLNPEIFAERGVELPPLPDRAWTLDEFLEIAQELSYDIDGDGRNDRYALSFAASDLLNNLAWLHLFGARMFNEDETEVILNSPEGVAGLQFMVDAIYEYEIAPRGAEGMGIYDVIGLFHEGRTAIGYGGPYEIGRIDRYVKEGSLSDAFDVHIAPFPHKPEVGPIAHHTSGGYVVFKQQDEEKLEMVMEFANFLTNRENTARLESLLYVTARDSVNQTLYDDSPFADEVDVYVRAIQNGVSYFGSTEVEFSPATQHLQAMFEAAFARTKTPEQALNDFVRDANRAIFGRR